MPGNRGNTSLKLKRCNEDPMQEYDRLPTQLRAWLAAAVLPWRPRSVRRAFDRAVARTQDPTRALEELDRLQAKLLARDAQEIWGRDYPGLSSARELVSMTKKGAYFRVARTPSVLERMAHPFAPRHIGSDQTTSSGP
jgi:hypothetical protein